MSIKLTPEIINKLNLKLEDKGSCLRYIAKGDIGVYNLTMLDKFIDSRFNICLTCTNEFNKIVRKFLIEQGVTDARYWNTLITLIVPVKK